MIYRIAAAEVLVLGQSPNQAEPHPSSIISETNKRSDLLAKCWGIDSWWALVVAGEESGKLGTILDRIATYQEKMEAIKSKVKSALMSPTVVLSIAIAVIIILPLSVIPSFEKMFKSFGSDLPTLTQMMVDASHWVSSNWPFMLLVSVGGSMIFSSICKRSTNMQYTADRLILKAPIIGVIVNKSAIVLKRTSRSKPIPFGPFLASGTVIALLWGNDIITAYLSTL
ncbi:MAG: type II secretion system F family protein [Arenicellaceae bacterium]|nr:type II secretion system F family protein [Arenicellaceae bacterium]